MYWQTFLTTCAQQQHPLPLASKQALEAKMLLQLPLRLQQS
jgi:hypothetical protein